MARQSLVLTKNGGQLGAHVVKDGPHDDRPKVQGKHSNRPQHGQVALLPGTPGGQVCTADKLTVIKAHSSDRYGTHTLGSTA